jgi:hypothetical protein
MRVGLSVSVIRQGRSGVASYAFGLLEGFREIQSKVDLVLFGRYGKILFYLLVIITIARYSWAPWFLGCLAIPACSVKPWARTKGSLCERGNLAARIKGAWRKPGADKVHSAALSAFPTNASSDRRRNWPLNLGLRRATRLLATLSHMT